MSLHPTVRAFVAAHLPRSGEFLARHHPRAPDAPTLLPPRGTSPAVLELLERALVYRLQACTGPTPPEELPAWDAAATLAGMRDGLCDAVDRDLMREALARFTATVSELRPWRGLPAEPGETRLAALAIVMALLEVGGTRGRAPRPLVDATRKGEGLAGVVRWIDRAWMRDLVETTRRAWRRRRELFAGAVLFRPRYGGSARADDATGDWIADDTLVAVRGVLDPRPTRDWLEGLLGQVLLDTEDHYRIRHVGVYLARQGELLRWPLSQLLGELPRPGEARGLRELRRRLDAALDRSAPLARVA